MSEPPPPAVAAGPADGAAPQLSDDAIERLLADFRAWLRTAPPPSPAPEPGAALDLAALLAPFVALRHEVNLQTRASRAQLEQNAQTLEALRQAVDALRRPPPAPAAPAAGDEALRPLLKTLVDVHDALALARRQVLRLRKTWPDDAPPPAPPALDVRLPWWARLLGVGGRVDAALAPLRAWRPPDEAARLRQQLDAMLVGYEMSLQRLERAMANSDLERVACVGAPFDPETMEVADVVRDPARGGTEVVEELRPGYRWRGRLLRYAQVRVARP